MPDCILSAKTTPRVFRPIGVAALLKTRRQRISRGEIISVLDVKKSQMRHNISSIGEGWISGRTQAAF